MAESQFPFPYTQGDLDALKASLSTARFETYLNKAGRNEAFAFALYLYNARLAKAFLFPLNVLEVTIRNAIDESLVAIYGADWPRAPAFVTGVLSEDGRRALTKAFERAGAMAPKDQIVATLTFDFWSNFFKPEYGDFWRTRLRIVLPHLPAGETRKTVQQAVKEINRFRNRIAHHEPILDLNAGDVMARIKDLVGYRCPRTLDWMRHHTTVNTVLRTRPRSAGSDGLTLASRQDPDFIRVTGDETLDVVLGELTALRPVVLRTDNDGLPTGACTAVDITAHLAERGGGDMDGIVSLKETSIDEVMARPEVAAAWQALDDQSPFAQAVTALTAPRLRVLVGVNSETQRATGVILRAHRRY
jgi:hypothetical protein